MTLTRSTTSVPNASVESPPWRGLAMDILAKLRSRGALSWAFIDITPTPASVPPLPPAPLAVAATSAEDHDDIFAELEKELAEEDLAGRRAPAPPRVDRVLRPRVDALLAVLRLAKTVESRESLDKLLTNARGVTVIGTGAPELDRLIVKILEEWYDVDPHSGSTSGPYIAQMSSVLKAGADEARTFGAFADTMASAIVHARPIVVVAPRAIALPSPIRALHPQAVQLKPLDRDMLMEICRLIYPDAEVIDIAEHLPTEAAVSRLDAETLTLALRGSDPIAAIRAVKDRLLPPKDDRPTLADFPLPAKVKASLGRLQDDLLAWRRGEIPWSDVSRGLLIAGPPGCGKTEIARLLARSTGFNVVAGSLAQWCGESSRSSDALRAMRSAFAQAAASAPCVLFLDELDAFGDRGRPADHNSSWTALVVGGLLELLDGFEGNEGVIAIGATNHVDAIDPAIRRAGRFDSVLNLGALNAELMPQALRWHLGKDLSDANLTQSANLALGLSGADVAAIVREARGTARAARRAMQECDLVEAITARRPPLPLSLARRVALHEAGHAVAAVALNLGQVESISLLSTGGLVQVELTESPLTRSDIEGFLVYKLAGRAAEQIFFGDVSSGAGGPSDSDLALATKMAAALEITWGQGQSLIWSCNIEEAAQHLRREPEARNRVDLHLKRAEARAGRILEGYRHLLEEVAAELLKVRRIAGEPLKRLMSKVTHRSTDAADKGAVPSPTEEADSPGLAGNVVSRLSQIQSG